MHRVTFHSRRHHVMSGPKSLFGIPKSGDRPLSMLSSARPITNLRLDDSHCQPEIRHVCVSRALISDPMYAQSGSRIQYTSDPYRDVEPHTTYRNPSISTFLTPPLPDRLSNDRSSYVCLVKRVYPSQSHSNPSTSCTRSQRP